MNVPPREASAKITCILEFSNSGYLRTILLNAQTDLDEAVLEKALDRLLKPGHVGWVRKLFRRS